MSMTGVPKAIDGSTPSVSLQAVIDASRRLDELSTARVLGDAAEAVHKAQKGGQPLGTLTPATILVGADGVRLAPPAPHALAYAAPERLRGLGGDRRSDVFSLGVVLWEALAHARLFDGATDDARKAAVLEQPFRPPSELNANVPAELDAICKKALAHDPADRYQSAKVMAAEIEAVLDDAGYPETNEEIAKYLDTAFSAGAPGATTASPGAALASPGAALAAKLAAASTTATPPASSTPASKASLTMTTLGMAPIREPAPAAPAAQAPPAKDPAPATTVIMGSLGSAGAIATPAPAPAPATPAAAPATEAPRAKTPSSAPLSPTAFSKAPAPASPAPAASAEPAAKVSPNPAITAPEAPGTPAPGTSPAIDPVAPSSAGTTPAAKPTTTAPGISPAMPAPLVPAPPIVADALPAGKSGAIAKPSIATAETVATPALVPTVDPAAPIEPASTSPSGIVGLPSMPPGASLPPMADDDFATSSGSPAYPEPPTLLPDATATATATEPAVDPAAAVSLPRPGTEKGRDVLAGWGWSTDSHAAITDDPDDDEDRLATRKRLMIAIGGAIGAIALIAIIAMAASGGDDAKPVDKQATAVTTREGPSRTAPDPTAQAAVAEPAPTEPTRVESAPAAETAAETAAASIDPGAETGSAAVAAAPPAAAPPAVEPAPAEPSPVEPAPELSVAATSAAATSAAATSAAAKIEPPKVAAKAEPTKAVAKAEPTKAVAKAEPKKVVAKTEPKKVVAKASAAPVDPYAAPAKAKPDAAAAYKTGFQQYVRGDTSGALATFKSSVTSNPKHAPTWRGLGLVYEKLGQKSQAKNAFRRYLQLSPGASDAAQIRDRMERL